jgi:CHAT domain-containing protein
MSGSSSGRPSLAQFLLLLLLSTISLGAAVVPWFGWSRSDSLATQRLERQLSQARPGGARLFWTSSPDAQLADREFLEHAQVAVLDMPLRTKQRLQALIYGATGDWENASANIAKLAEAESANPQILNDRGAAYIALGERDPIYYFKALQLFESAGKLAPDAQAPRFNTVLAYRMTGLEQMAQSGWMLYQQSEPDMSWIRALAPQAEPSESQLAQDMRAALKRGDTSRAKDLFERNTDAYRHLLTDYALNPADPYDIDPVVSFVASELRKRADETIPAILASLTTRDHDRVIESRQLIHAGAVAYLQSKPVESLRFYGQARAALEGTSSLFDELWLDLNQADTETRIRKIGEARRRLDDVIEKSRGHNLKWLLGLALTAKGASVELSDNYSDYSKNVSEAIQVLREVGDIRDTVRPLYYLAASRYIAGDLEDSLRFAHEAVRVMRSDDPIHRAELYQLSGQLLHQLGFPVYGTAFLTQAVAEAQRTENPQAMLFFLLNLAVAHEAQHDPQAARKEMAEIEAVRNAAEASMAEDSLEKQVIRFNVNLVCGRIETAVGNFVKAERCLKDNDFIVHSDSRLASLGSPLPELARLHSMSGQPELASREFREAASIIEKNDEYFVSPQVRLSFENQRREFYDSAIAFEYSRDRMDDAWSYLQRYRAKLFLEFMGQINPSVRRVHSDAIQADAAKKLPKDLQVIEYLMLDDRLLIWVVSDKTFKSRSFPIARAVLDQNVSDFVAHINDQKDVSRESQELYRSLIGPIEDLLDPSRAVAIIPDLSLHRLPFDALQNPATKEYLVARYALLESSSLTHLLAASSETPARNSLVAFGAMTDEASYSLEFPPLRKIYSSMKSYSGDDANKNSFLAAMTTAAVFHYAGHSRDAADPLQSTILLDGMRDGRNSVTALEISQQRMRPNAVVILSSCDSSLGNSRDGVGIRGLTSAFLSIGAGAVVGSLWPVDAAGTSKLMFDFHKAFGAGHVSVAQALRQAQLAFMKAYPQKTHPYYWSGFVVTGNLSALR